MRMMLRSVVLLSVGATLPIAFAQPVAYLGATLVDPGRGLAIADAVLVVDDGRIVAAGERSQVAVPPQAIRVLLTGKWILPGYIDVHTHLAGRGTAKDNFSFFSDAPGEAESEALHEARRVLDRTLARHVRSGITTVLDVGGPEWTLQQRERWRGQTPAPRVFASGPIIGPPRGFGAGGSGYIEVNTEQEARAAVRRLAGQRVDVVKFYMVPAEHTGRPFAALAPMFGAAIQEASALGLRTTAHAMRFPIARAAVEAGIDSLAHGILDVHADAAFMERMSARKVAFASTLMVLQGPGSVMGGRVRFTKPEWQWGDAAAIADLLAASARTRQPQSGPRGPDLSHRAVLWPGGLAIAQANLRRVHDAQVTIAVGTDAGFLGILHGPSIFHEFQLMADAGLTPMQILRAATLGGARFLGREDQLGTLESGKLADFVVLEADPLADLDNASRIERVVIGGREWRADDILPADAEEDALRAKLAHE